MSLKLCVCVLTVLHVFLHLVLDDSHLEVAIEEGAYLMVGVGGECVMGVQLLLLLEAALTVVIAVMHHALEPLVIRLLLVTALAHHVQQLMVRTHLLPILHSLVERVPQVMCSATHLLHQTLHFRVTDHQALH